MKYKYYLRDTTSPRKLEKSYVPPQGFKTVNSGKFEIYSYLISSSVSVALSQQPIIFFFFFWRSSFIVFLLCSSFLCCVRTRLRTNERKIDCKNGLITGFRLKSKRKVYAHTSQSQSKVLNTWQVKTGDIEFLVEFLYDRNFKSMLVEFQAMPPTWRPRSLRWYF
jgi:hypothetical protein